MKLITIHPALKAGIIFGILLLLFLLYRGCQSSKLRVAENAVLKAAFDSMALKSERDSMASVQRAKDYEDSLHFANSIIDLKENQLDATEQKLIATTQDAFNWKKKYESIRPDMDTSVTMVPNEFVEDAHQCFNQVEEKDRLIKLYVRENHELDSAHQNKEQLQDNRIKQLGQERDAVRLTLNDCLAAAQRQNKLLKPRGKMLLSISALWSDQILPHGVGGGLIYQDKYNRQYGISVYGTNVGRLTTALLNLPLSFRRK